MKRTKKDRRTALEKEVDRLTEELVGMKPATDEYKATVERIEQLTKANQERNYPGKPREKLNANTVLVVLGSLGEIILMLNFEKVHVITSKCMGRILKGRV